MTFFLTSLSLYIFTMWKCIANNHFCRDGIYFDKILVSEYKLFKRSNKANLFLALVQYPVSQMKMTFQEIRIIATDPCIGNQLRDVNTICRRSWYIAAQIWKIYDFKIEVVPFIINFSTELTTVVKFEVCILLNILNHVIFPAKYKYRKQWMYHISVFMFDLNIIHMSCEYDWYWKILGCSTEYEVCD